MFRKYLFVIVCLAIPCLVFADTIYLKNGKQIKDVEAVEEGNFVKYYRAGQEVILPKDTVDRVEIIALEKAPHPTVNLESYKTEKDKEFDRKLKESNEKVEAAKKRLDSTNELIEIDKQTDYDEEYVANIKGDILSIPTRKKVCNFIADKIPTTAKVILEMKRNGLSLTKSLLETTLDDDSKQKYSEFKKQERTLEATYKMLKEMEAQFCK